MKIGETFTDNNVKLKVIKKKACIGCFYANNPSCNKVYECSALLREDGESVIFKKVKNMNDEIRIEIPEGMEIDKEKSNFEIGKIAFKKKKQEIKTWRDLIGFDIPIGSALMVEKVENPFSYSFFTSDDRSVFIDEKHAKSALAMAMISQLMPFYGGSITDEEWNNSQINKYTICRKKDYSSFLNSSHYEFLAFHTKKQRYDFFYNNEQLVNDYLMIARL